MNSRFFRRTSGTAVAFAVALAPIMTHAAQPYLGMEYAAGFGLPSMDLRAWIPSVIRSFMGLLGLILVMQIMWGGFLMMTHGGSEDRKSKAIGTIKDAVVGMIIIMSSASAVRFVVNAVLNAANIY